VSAPCFSAALPFEPEGEFAGFVNAKASDVFNPWPQLVDLDARGDAWSQPFLRALYIPTTRPWNAFSTAKDSLLPLKWRVALVHEAAGHLAFETPAREWARTTLALAFEQLGEFAQGDFSSWGSFKAFNLRFRLACDGIRLPEELFAVAYSFGTLPMAEAEQLQPWERHCVGHYDSSLPGFADLYFGGIKRAVSMLVPYSLGKREWPVALLATFLEPLNTVPKLPEVGDCRERCEMLVQAMRRLNSAEDLEAWLLGTIRDLDDAKGLRIALGLQAELFRHKEARAAGPLAQLVRAGRLAVSSAASERWSRKAFETYWSAPTSRPTRLAILVPVRLAGQWLISPWLTNYTRQLRALLVLESLRQQLDEGRGFDCPIAAGDVEAIADQKHPACICGDFRLTMERLVHWASTGDLGTGASAARAQWHPLTGPCS
jgi:hypothetical protein